MDKSKAYLVDSIYTSNGTIATMYADSLDDLGYDDYSGVDKNGLAIGYGDDGRQYTYIECPFREGKIDVSVDLIEDGEDEGGGE